MASSSPTSPAALGRSSRRMHTQLSATTRLSRLADTVVFDQLRIDPFYRSIARVHPDLGPAVDALINRASAPFNRTFVHADFSPKNLLVHHQATWPSSTSDGARSDPAFDVGFFTSIITLKAFHTGVDEARYLLATRSSFSDNYHRGRAGAS